MITGDAVSCTACRSPDAWWPVRSSSGSPGPFASAARRWTPLTSRGGAPRPTIDSVRSNRSTRRSGKPARGTTNPDRKLPSMSEWFPPNLELESNNTWKTRVFTGGTNCSLWPTPGAVTRGTSLSTREGSGEIVARGHVTILWWRSSTLGCWDRATSSLLISFIQVPPFSATSFRRASGRAAPSDWTGLDSQKPKSTFWTLNLPVAVSVGSGRTPSSSSSGETRRTSSSAQQSTRPMRRTQIKGERTVQIGSGRWTTSQFHQRWPTTTGTLYIFNYVLCPLEM